MGDLNPRSLTPWSPGDAGPAARLGPKPAPQRTPALLQGQNPLRAQLDVGCRFAIEADQVQPWARHQRRQPLEPPALEAVRFIGLER